MGFCLSASFQTAIAVGRSPFPAAVDRFHARIQDESFHRAPVELAAASLFATAALAAIRRTRRTQRGRLTTGS